MDLDDDDDEQQQINDESGFIEGAHKPSTHHHKTKISDDKKPSNGQQPNLSEGASNTQPQDEWEDFDSSNPKYEQLRLKYSSRNNNDDDNDDEFFDDENDPNNNDDTNEKNPDREQVKDKPVWKTDQIKQETETAVAPIVDEIIEEPKPASTSSGAYRPPHARTGGSSVTVVSGVSQRPTKKKQPNLASTDEFPTLKSTVNKK
jgi:hypothetical protein